MIRGGGTDPFTKEPRAIVECDYEDCDRCEFGPHGFDPQSTADLYQGFGWEVGARQHGDEWASFCPTHSAPGMRCPHKTVLYPTGRRADGALCKRCGASIPGQPVAPSAQAASRLLARAKLAKSRATAEEGA